jgi:hypothetical protein
VELVSGDMEKSIPQYLKEHPQMQVSFLHVDVDQYPTAVAILENFWDRMPLGGLVFLDDYGAIPEQTQAADEFFTKKNQKIQTLNNAPQYTYVQKI